MPGTLGSDAARLFQGGVVGKTLPIPAMQSTHTAPGSAYSRTISISFVRLLFRFLSTVLPDCRNPGPTGVHRVLHSLKPFFLSAQGRDAAASPVPNGPLCECFPTRITGNEYCVKKKITFLFKNLFVYCVYNFNRLSPA